MPDQINERNAPGTAAAVSDPAAVRDQYRTADRLGTRISIHARYSVNKQGFGNWIASHFDIRPGASVLELGCGTGEMWLGREETVRRCARFILTDLSEGMLDRARETLRGVGGIEFAAADIQSIPYADGTFDAVIANMMLYHVPDLPRALREVKRVLKPDGVFCCATYGEYGMMETLCGLFRAWGVRNRDPHRFTLQNGEEKLKTVFRDVRRYLYEDALEVTNAEDLADYIGSLTGMTDFQRLTREEILSVLRSHMTGGVLRIPKEYGMFIARP
ncbi:MAG: methyltransferase domain-containing protein [Clostridia bacterium]|nr:methyltransferase domain-containing protein [Clostridia bacterium]